MLQPLKKALMLNLGQSYSATGEEEATPPPTEQSFFLLFLPALNEWSKHVDGVYLLQFHSHAIVLSFQHEIICVPVKVIR
jgi:hypothetical protein